MTLSSRLTSRRAFRAVRWYMGVVSGLLVIVEDPYPGCCADVLELDPESLCGFGFGGSAYRGERGGGVCATDIGRLVEGI